ncbi:MAG: class I SAM-dependent methyltransferase [Patescibacteria group bacterium]|nr:class I SAM-dependent methyltransferase [Patescibacteria group bacterium]
MDRITLITKLSDDYELLDSGKEEKFERYGSVLLSRPDPQALWEKKMSEGEWAKAQGRYERKDREGEWHANNLPKEWEISFGGLKFLIRPTSFKHTGLFPEQLPNWEWMQGQIMSGAKALNLFGYTGGASLAVAKAGAEMTHVDASKIAVAWAKENAKLSGLEEKPIRWIIEDALLFVKREIKRGNKYDGIIMDPPAFGHGPKNELWKIEKDFIELVKLCQELLSEKPLFFLINGYAAGYSPLAFAYNLEPLVKKFGGKLEYGDLTIEEKSGRLLPCGIFARWRG